jgi:hypothetical protein
MGSVPREAAGPDQGSKMTFGAGSVRYKRTAIILLAFSASLLVAGTASASPIKVDGASVKQNSGECNFPIQSPPKEGADNPANCRSTNSKIALYLTNQGNTSDCKFDVKVAWGDGKNDSFPNVPGGPNGRQFLTDHDYSDVGIYIIKLSGSVVSGPCDFGGGEAQFSDIPATTPYPEGPPISADQILERAADWVTAKVPYSQTKWYSDVYGTYREDCSGFTSMAWDLDYSLNTSTLRTVATLVKSGLKGVEPGDVILKTPIHAFIFVKWYDKKHTQAWVYEEAGVSSKSGSGATLKHFGLSTFKGYTVYRYKNER